MTTETALITVTAQYRTAENRLNSTAMNVWTAPLWLSPHIPHYTQHTTHTQHAEEQHTRDTPAGRIPREREERERRQESVKDGGVR